MRQTQEGCAHLCGRKTAINAARTLLLLAHLMVSRAAEALLRLEWSGCWGFTSAPGGPKIILQGTWGRWMEASQAKGKHEKKPQGRGQGAGWFWVLASIGKDSEDGSGVGGLSRESGRTCSWPLEASGSLVGRRRSSRSDSSTGMAQSGMAHLYSWGGGGHRTEGEVLVLEPPSRLMFYLPE